mmetsp:Transcript_18842/g.31537  ORF Transcript_18842/g.31537 Transcript_18842/m.31537 type:complete len:98 (+) Transcript_18842:272-565(+)
MPYITGDGTVQDNRSLMRASIITDVFWFIVNTIGLFFSTLVNPRDPLPAGKYASKRTSPVGRNVYSRSSGNNGTAPSDGEKKKPNIRTLPKNCASGG